MKTIGSSVNLETYQDFLDNCNNNGTNPSEKIRELVEYYNQNGDPDEQEPQIEYRDKEVIKEVKVPVEKTVEKIVKVPEIQYKDREVIKEVPKITAPEYLPNYTCSQGCNHPNKNYKKRPKSKCNNCDQFNKLESGNCVWCGKDELEPITKDDLNDLEIPLPTDSYDSQSYKCPNGMITCTASKHSF